VIELAEVFRQHGPAYRKKFASRMLPSHLRAMSDIENCRTEAMGGHVYQCPECGRKGYSYHSCKNRHCPKCQGRSAQAWLEKQDVLRLPVPYFMLTFTLPDALREIARRNQKTSYNLLFRASSAAAQQLAEDPRFVGGQIGLIGVLHTWARNLTYHPHIHYLVPGGGLSPDRSSWLTSRKDFLLPVKALSLIYRARFRSELQKTNLFEEVPGTAWTTDWVVHCLPVGNGLAALKYLAPYIFRVALNNRRILKMASGMITFSYKDSKSGETRFSLLQVDEFIRRFLQHVLPKGFVKVRYYGIFSSGNRKLLAAVRKMLGVLSKDKCLTENTKKNELDLRCPSCGCSMHYLQTLRPRSHPPPPELLLEAA
jgi:hypothetical protein